MQSVLPLLCLFCSRGKKNERVAYPELKELAQLVLSEVAFLAILIVLPPGNIPLLNVL